MGFGVEKGQTGKYFLQTNANQFNLSRRMDGISFMKVNLTRLQTPDPNHGEIPADVQQEILF